MTKFAEIQQVKKKSCPCITCGREVPAGDMQPYSVYWKRLADKRGHWVAACSYLCALEFVEKVESC